MILLLMAQLPQQLPGMLQLLPDDAADQCALTVFSAS
jgi:hypothetical protein